MEPHRIEVPERFGLAAGAHVNIKPRQSWAAANRVQAAGLVVRTSSTGPTGDVRADVLERSLAILETAVVSWHGIEDSGGKPLSASRAGYMHDDFDPALGDWLVEAIEAHYASQRRTEPEGKPAAPDSPQP